MSVSVENLGDLVRKDLDSIKSTLKSYSTSYSDISNSWKGASCDNFISKAEEFISEYEYTIDTCMTAYATACDDYREYMLAKKNLKISQDNFNEASRAVNSGNTSEESNLRRFKIEIDEYTQKMENLKGKINANLATASSYQLTASNNSSNVSTSSSNSSSDKRVSPNSSYINGAIDWAVGIANDDTHGYSQQTRYGNPNYDCSSLVINAWDNAGVPVKEYGASYTGNMREAFLATGQFEWIPGDPEMDDLVPGDVLLTEGVHTEMYIGDGQNVRALSNYDGYDGDSSGDEICVCPYSDWSSPWQGVLRYKGN